VSDDLSPFWNLVDETTVWFEPDGQPATLAAALLDGYRGLPLAEVISILRIGREIGQLENRRLRV
jgi:hypothetical protein